MDVVGSLGAVNTIGPQSPKRGKEPSDPLKVFRDRLLEVEVFGQLQAKRDCFCPLPSGVAERLLSNFDSVIVNIEGLRQLLPRIDQIQGLIVQFRGEDSLVNADPVTLDFVAGVSKDEERDLMEMVVLELCKKEAELLSQEQNLLLATKEAFEGISLLVQDRPKGVMRSPMGKFRDKLAFPDGFGTLDSGEKLLALNELEKETRELKTEVERLQSGGYDSDYKDHDRILIDHRAKINEGKKTIADKFEKGSCAKLLSLAQGDSRTEELNSYIAETLNEIGIGEFCAVVSLLTHEACLKWAKSCQNGPDTVSPTIRGQPASEVYQALILEPALLLTPKKASSLISRAKSIFKGQNVEGYLESIGVSMGKEGSDFIEDLPLSNLNLVRTYEVQCSDSDFDPSSLSMSLVRRSLSKTPKLLHLPPKEFQRWFDSFKQWAAELGGGQFQPLVISYMELCPPDFGKIERAQDRWKKRTPDKTEGPTEMIMRHALLIAEDLNVDILSVSVAFGLMIYQALNPQSDGYRCWNIFQQNLRCDHEVSFLNARKILVDLGLCAASTVTGMTLYISQIDKAKVPTDLKAALLDLVAQAEEKEKARVREVDRTRAGQGAQFEVKIKELINKAQTVESNLQMLVDDVEGFLGLIQAIEVKGGRDDDSKRQKATYTSIMKKFRDKNQHRRIETRGRQAKLSELGRDILGVLDEVDATVASLWMKTREISSDHGQSQYFNEEPGSLLYDSMRGLDTLFRIIRKPVVNFQLSLEGKGTLSSTRSPRDLNKVIEALEILRDPESSPRLALAKLHRFNELSKGKR